jgi:exodeoxyribonuclease VII large subunit
VAEQRALTVTEAMTTAKQALEMVRVRVVGEVSEFNDKPGYKAAYFTVSDGGAAMPCLMWRDQYTASGVALRCGMLVELAGSFSAYVPKGRMQFTVRTLTLAGEGSLRLQVAALARKLEAEGLMRPERKRMLPRFPQRIAVVTSPRGKAIHDVIRTLRRRYPLAELQVAGVAVEGDVAPAAIVEGLRIAGESSAEVVLLVRGGGSYEDLMPFNAEEVARAVVACPVPVVSGIGHEPDNSIADMVADVRCSTPTAAAESVAPSLEELSAVVTRERRALGRALQARVHSATLRVARLAERPVLRDPHAVLGAAEQALDDARTRLRRLMPLRVREARQQMQVLQARLARGLPRMVSRQAEQVEVAGQRLRLIGRRMLEPASARIVGLEARIEASSPLRLLAERGYAIVYAADRRSVLTSIGDATAGDGVSIRFHDGFVDALVTSTESKSLAQTQEER